MDPRGPSRSSRGRAPAAGRPAAAAASLLGRRLRLPILGRLPRAAAGLAAGGAALLVAACAPPRDGAASAPALLYVLNAGDGTATPLESATGRPTGRPIPVGPGPVDAVPAPDGGLLVLSGAAAPAGALTLVTRAGPGWAARPVPLEPGARAGLLAGDGHRYAAVAYDAPGGAPAAAGTRCRLALVDLRAGRVAGAHTICGGREAVLAVALGDAPAGAGGPTVYLGIWRGGPAPGGRVVALRAATGDLVGLRPLAGAPERLVLAAAPGRGGRRLYGVEALPDADGPDGAASAGREREGAGARWWRVLGLDPATLSPEAEHRLDERPLWLAVAPDGDHAYALTARGGVASGTDTTQVDLTTGAARRLGTLPGVGVGLAVTADRLYVPDPAGGAVWVVDRRHGRLVQTVPVGRGPRGITLGAGA